MDLGEIVEIYAKEFKEEVIARGFTFRGVVALMKSYMLNENYLTHRLAKGSVPINVFRAACEVVGVDFHDYVVEYDLSDVPTYQIEEEIERRKE
jgi:hypothetical protein